MKKYIEPTAESFRLVTGIAQNVTTFHRYHHILFDIARTFETKEITYVEIGCYAGASACLMLQRKNTNVVSIDIGQPVKEEIAHGNIKKYNIHNNSYSYIKGDSSLLNTIMKLRNIIHSGIDILFIDGSHKLNQVILDFHNYSVMVNSGGFVVFDDYDDLKHSPGVRPAVDYLNRWFFDDYYIYERVQNEFIIQKK
jgi:predicted O-methyltransferase YrrM